MAILDLSSAPDSSPDLLEFRHRRREQALRSLVERGAARGIVRDPVLALQALSRRERLHSSAHGKAVAIPHARSITVVRPWIALGRCARGIEWPGAEDAPVQLVICVLSPAGLAWPRHLARVAAVVDAVRLQRQRQWLLEVAEGEGLRAWFAGLGA